MRLTRLAGEGLDALGANRVRTLLMMAGTVVGIAALTVTMAMGAGAEGRVMERVAVFGFRAIMVMASGAGSSSGGTPAATLRMEDVEAIRERIDGIEAMSPTIMQGGMTVRADGGWTEAMVFAIEPDWHRAWDWYAAEGEGVTAADMAGLERSCVLGATLARELFGDASPLGEHVRIGNVRFRVKGVLGAKGSSPMGTDMDNRALIPLSTGMRRLFNQEHLSQIRIKVDDPDRLVPVAGQVRELLRERHRIGPAEEDDFRVRSAEDIADFVRGVSGTLSMLLTALAVLSLLVGGIVLMNILLVSVSERTREIGLRRALGASRRDVLLQFLTESLAVTTLGMLLGSVLAWGVAVALAAFTAVPVAPSWESVALAAAAAVLVGCFFGVQPARKAARLDPADALR